ncbi:MAG: hypothetical protein ACT452_05535 [Microthrixaceae bacterium]
MADLRRSLYALVDHPPALPVAVDVVVERGARFKRHQRMRVGAASLAVVAVVSGLGFGIARQGSTPGVELATSGPQSAGYIAEQPGGYVATGTWRLTITRNGQVIELTSASDEPCGQLGLILPGDEVRGSIAGRGSTLRVGERFSCP